MTGPRASARVARDRLTAGRAATARATTDAPASGPPCAKPRNGPRRPWFGRPAGPTRIAPMRCAVWPPPVRGARGLGEKPPPCPHVGGRALRRGLLGDGGGPAASPDPPRTRIGRCGGCVRTHGPWEGAGDQRPRVEPSRGRSRSLVAPSGRHAHGVGSCGSHPGRTCRPAPRVTLPVCVRVQPGQSLVAPASPASCLGPDPSR